MEPLPLNTRRFYATLFFVLFVLILPIVALYASGYRFEGVGIVSTGGIFVATPVSGFSIAINGEELERSSLFTKSFFFDNLAPDSYVVQAEAVGYYPWSKTLTVEPRLVTDVSVLAVQQPLLVREVLIATSSSQVATSTIRLMSRDEHNALSLAFSATSTPVMSTTTEGVVVTLLDESRGVQLTLNEGDLSLHYNRNDAPPSSFCVRPSSCVKEFSLERSTETVTSAQFFAGGVLYSTKESGVYFVETDIRSPRLTIPVFTAPRARFTIFNNELFIESNNLLYEVSGF